MTGPARVWLAALAAVVFLLGPGPRARAQDDDPLVVRPAPPAVEDFETDKNKDGVPDGWYNLRDAAVVPEGGVVGPKFLRFSCNGPGRPARLSRAFGIDGRKHEAVVLGLWVRMDRVQVGERLGEEPGLIIDFLGDKLRQETRGSLGPWTARVFGAAPVWTRVAKRIPVPPGTRDAIMSVGLLGATGVLDVDGLTIDLVPVGGAETTNLVKNPDFELGDPDPWGWIVHNGARRGTPGLRSTTALELARSGAQGMTGLALPVGEFPGLAVSVMARGHNLRGSGGAAAFLFFLDEDGRVVPDPQAGAPVFRWSGSFDWRADRVAVTVPRGASRAVLQFEKLDGLGSLRLDDVAVTATPDPQASAWTPYHVADDTSDWQPVKPSTRVAPGSPLDFSFLLDDSYPLDGPRGDVRRVQVKGGRLHYAQGPRARFFGVQLLPPTAFADAAKADTLVDRLARSGVNLVRLGDLDTPIGPDRSLFDDTRDDTRAFDPVALARLDHLIAALSKRGIYVALELQGARRFRAEDGVPAPGALPPGGGPAAVFDPALTKLATDSARALLKHVNPETGRALKDEPALAWVTLAGEVTLFNLIDDPGSLPADYAKALRDLGAKSSTGIGRRFWQGLEAAHWKGLADALRKDGLKAPVAGVSHWRRESEFSEVQAGPGLDLVDDRIYWNGPTWIAPRWRSMLWSLDGGLTIDAARKRRADRPYVVGQWCDFTQGVWAYPFEAAEQMLAAETARAEGWDALVRRGVFIYPEPWGSSAPGTAGGEDIFQIPEVANAAPHVFALWPHAASVMLRGGNGAKPAETERGKADATRQTAKAARRNPIPGWEPDRGRVVIETVCTEGVAGWSGGEAVTLPTLTFDVESPYAVVVASSAGNEPLARARRLLVSAVARVSPTGFRWADDWRRETADPGRPPLLAEPVRAKVTWRGKSKGSVKGFTLDNDGNRVGPARVTDSGGGATLVIDGRSPALHWELVAD